MTSLPTDPFDLIYLALEESNTEAVQKLRELIYTKEVDVNEWVDEITLLGQVSLLGDLELVSSMISLVDDINFNKVERVVTPLMDASTGKSLEIVRLLVQNGADPNIIREGTFALECAAQYGRKNIFNFLLPLTNLELHESAQTILNFVKEKSLRKPLNAATLELFDLLRRSDSPKMKIVKAISQGADVNAYDETNRTILMRACQRFSADFIQLLIKAGADPNLGQPIFEAFSNKHYLLDIVKVFMNSGVNPNSANFDGVTSLMIASAYNVTAGHKHFKVGYELCEYLINSGAELNLVDKIGRTSLMLAAMAGETKIVKLLISQGANPILVDREGKSALDYAKDSFYIKQSGDEEIIEFLSSFLKD
jgi:ankyrin repeat protein